jgi:hypothetical protein
MTIKYGDSGRNGRPTARRAGKVHAAAKRTRKAEGSMMATRLKVEEMAMRNPRFCVS